EPADSEAKLDKAEPTVGKTDIKPAQANLGIAEKQLTVQAPEKPSRSLDQAQLEAVIKQISDRVEVLAAKPHQAVVIHLRPEDLGNITLTVKSVGSVIDTQIQA